MAAWQKERRGARFGLMGDHPDRSQPVRGRVVIQETRDLYINALIAPRLHLGLTGNFDRLTPPAGLNRIDAALREVYAELGAPKAPIL